MPKPKKNIRGTRRPRAIPRATLAAKNNISLPPLNPMVFHARYLHITEIIFYKIDTKSLKKLRQVSTSWRKIIDDQKILWKNETGTKAFKLACENGHSKLADILIKNSKKFNIDLNHKNQYGMTPFHHACWGARKHGDTKIVELLVQKSTEFNIDLNTKIQNGQTAFLFACMIGELKVVAYSKVYKFQY